MGKTDSNTDFKLMSLTYKIRDFLLPRRTILEEVGIKPGFSVLDYGCGPGSYVSAAAELVGKTGRVYALDMSPLSIRSVRKIMSRKKLTNLKAIHSDCRTGLPDNNLDVVLLYDVFHDLRDPDGVLEELHRLLKPGGILSFSDHHLKEAEILRRVTATGLFKLSKKGKRTYSFSKVSP